jgi:hypothetical protein
MKETVMTTTVRVQARAWGATVQVNDETIELGAHQDRAFHIEEGQSLSLTVTHGEKPIDRAAELADEEVPGRAQNDQLLGQGEQTATNETGATETARDTDGALEPPSQPQRGRGSRPSPAE